MALQEYVNWQKHGRIGCNMLKLAKIIFADDSFLPLALEVSSEIVANLIRSPWDSGLFLPVLIKVNAFKIILFLFAQKNWLPCLILHDS